MRSVARPALRASALACLLLQGSPCVRAQAPGGAAPAAATRITSRRLAGRIPFEFVGNHVYVRARVNGSGPFRFLFDTGATASYFDAARAKALGLAAAGSVVKGVSLELPGVRLRDQSFTLQSVTLGAYDGQEVDGLLGYDFISRFVVEIDYLNRTLGLHEPAGYRYSGRGEVIPLTMLEDDSGGKVPLVRVEVRQAGRGAVRGNFIADTGVRSAVSFNTPFGEANQLLRFAGKTIQAPLGGGSMVRESRQAVGRVPALRLGRFTIRNPIAIFFRDRGGVLASPEFDGVIGGEILRRFKVVYDYSRRRMILEPNRHLAEPEEYDMSGMLIAAEGRDLRTFRVRQLIEGSPAALTGLRAGDIITAVNGRPASSLTLERLRRMFKRRGRSYRLGVARGGREFQTNIKLKRLI